MAWCWIFCCPPFPSSIANKLAFWPPNPTTYCMREENGKYRGILTHRAEWQYSERELANLDWFFTRTNEGNSIACLYVKCVDEPQFTILFSHGSGSDLGLMSSYYVALGSYVKCNIFSYDYAGYGASSGKATEKNMYSDMEAAWNCLLTKYRVCPKTIILYGQSIGTVPTVDLASRHECAGIVLHSAFMSGIRIACPNIKKTCRFDSFCTIDKVHRIRSPVLVIHGTHDEVIDFSHGTRIYDECPRAVEPLWVHGAGHNDVELFSAFLDRLEHFICVELVEFAEES